MATLGSRPMDARSTKILGKLSSEDLEKVCKDLWVYLHQVSLSLLQFVHRVIDGVCDKQGPRYEAFAKSLSLADFSRLVRCVESAVKAVGREGGTKQQVYTLIHVWSGYC